MTMEQAQAVLNNAAADNQLSRVEPNLTRRDVVQLARAALSRVSRYAIDIPKIMERHLLEVAQDCLDPVQVRYAYDSAGNVFAGWNKEEVAIRNGLAPSPAPKESVEHIPSLMDEIKDSLRRQQQGIAANSPVNWYEEKVKFEIQKKLNEEFARRASNENLKLVMKIFGAQGAKSTKPEPPAKQPDPPKPDPTDPKFCLKRPKPKL